MATGELRLGRTRGWATAMTAACVGIGVILAIRGFRGSPAMIIPGGILVVGGILAYARALRPWFLDGQGISLAGNRRLQWAEVTRVQVIATTPQGAGKGTPRVDITLHAGRRHAKLMLLSRKDAGAVTAILEQHLPEQVAGRRDLWLIPNAWKHVM